MKYLVALLSSVAFAADDCSTLSLDDLKSNYPLPYHIEIVQDTKTESYFIAMLVNGHLSLTKSHTLEISKTILKAHYVQQCYRVEPRELKIIQ